MTASPAPTMSIGPRKGRDGAHSTVPSRLRADDPALRHGDEHLAAIPRGQFAARPPGSSRRSAPRRSLASLASSAAFILKMRGGYSLSPRRESAMTQRAVRRKPAEGVAHRASGDPGLGRVDLVQDDHARRPRGAGQRSDGENLADHRRSGVGVQFFESSRLSSRGGRPRSSDERFAVGERASSGVARKWSSRTPLSASSACRSS